MECIVNSSKVYSAQRILTNLSVYSNNFFDLIDNDKLTAIDVNELNNILDSGCFSIPEKDYIRELRRKTMNRKTAKQSRIKDKYEYQELSGEIDALMDRKYSLAQEKEDLCKQISFYQEKCA